MSPQPAKPQTITEPDDPRLHPKLRALWRFWLDLGAGRAMPRADEVTPFLLRPWLGNVLLLDPAGDGDFRYRLYGSTMAEAFGFDLTGKTVTEAEPLIGPLPIGEYRRVAATGRAEATARMSPARRDWLQMDKLALPLASADGGPVTRILGAIYTSEAPAD